MQLRDDLVCVFGTALGKPQKGGDLEVRVDMVTIERTTQPTILVTDQNFGTKNFEIPSVNGIVQIRDVCFVGSKSPREKIIKGSNLPYTVIIG